MPNNCKRQDKANAYFLKIKHDVSVSKKPFIHITIPKFLVLFRECIMRIVLSVLRLPEESLRDEKMSLPTFVEAYCLKN